MGSRPLAALASVVLAVLGVVFVLPPECAYACSCGGGGGSQKEIVEGALSDSEAVFSGEVVAVEKGTATASGPGNDTVILRTSEVWKGPDQGNLEVSTPGQEITCGHHFAEGREYLVYAYGKHDLKVDLCSQTKPLSKADADLAVLGDGARGQRAARASRTPQEAFGGHDGRVGGAGAGGIVLGGSAACAHRLGVEYPNFREPYKRSSQNLTTRTLV